MEGPNPAQTAPKKRLSPMMARRLQRGLPLVRPRQTPRQRLIAEFQRKQRELSRLERERQRRAAAKAIVTRQESGEERAAWLRQVVTTAIRPRERRDSSGRSSARSGDSGEDGPSGPSDRPSSNGAAA
jgi:hypothetical protein